MDNGWRLFADAWIADVGDQGDFGRRYVLDPVMLERARTASARGALDVGCGEGRFCRMLGAAGMTVTGLDPTPALIAAARARDRVGRYVKGVAEALPFADASFDLVVSYLSLIDIPDIDAGDQAPRLHYPIDNYLDDRGMWMEWRGIRILNYHRPLRRYMKTLLDAGLRLTWFDEPEPIASTPPSRARAYRRVPWFLVMEWRKPA